MTRRAFITGLLLALGVGAAVFRILEERYCGVVGYARNIGMSEGQRRSPPTAPMLSDYD